MEFCTSWDHARLAWDAYDNEPCPLCQALKLGEAKDRAICELKEELAKLQPEHVTKRVDA